MNNPGLIVQTFMTHRMSDDSIKMLATDREPQQKKIMLAVRRSLDAAPGAMQHCVIYGPRGFGKSFMTRLVQIETQELAEKDGISLPFILLPEEQHNLTRNPHALPNFIAQRIHDWRTGEDSSWSGAMFQWPDPDKEPLLWEQSVLRVEDELDLCFAQQPGMAIVVIENFDMLLSTVFKASETEQRLRKWLDRSDNRLMLIATATGSVDMDYDRPLFQAFQPVRLQPWSQEACIAYFNRRRVTEGLLPLDDSRVAKARAVADFIGGNPRLAQLLADVLETQDALTVAGTMNALADKLSDYYRRRIDDLPPLSQGLLDALIRGGEPASQTELAERVGAAGQNQIARVMKELERSDIITGTPALDSREILYRVTDRVFVHFYRLRQGNQEAIKTPLGTILDFLRAFYSVDEKRRYAVDHLKAGRLVEGRLFADLDLEGSPSVNLSSRYLLDFKKRLAMVLSFGSDPLPSEMQHLIDRCETSPEKCLEQLSAVIGEDKGGSLESVLVEAYALSRMGLTAKAIEQLEASLAAKDDEVFCFYLNLELLLLAEVAESEVQFAKRLKILFEFDVESLPPDLASFALSSKAWWMVAVGFNAEALPVCIEALQMANFSKSQRALCDAFIGIAAVQHQLGNDAESVAAALQALEYAEHLDDIKVQVESLDLLVQSFCNLESFSEMMDKCSKKLELALRLADHSLECDAVSQLAWALERLGRVDEARSEATKALSLAQQLGDIEEQLFILRLMGIISFRSGDYEGAIDWARKVLEIAGDNLGHSEVAEALRLWARTESERGNNGVSVEIGLRSINVARSIDDFWTLKRAIRDAISAASRTPSTSVIDEFYGQVVREIEDASAGNDVPGWSLWLDDLISASARAGHWVPLDSLLEKYGEHIEVDQVLQMKVLGETIADIGLVKGGQEAYESAKAAIERLIGLGRLCDSPNRLGEWVNQVASGFAGKCRDVDLVDAFSQLLKARGPGVWAEAGELLSHFRVVLGVKNPQVVLSRLDPDIAMWIRRALDLPEAKVIRGKKNKN